MGNRKRGRGCRRDEVPQVNGTMELKGEYCRASSTVGRCRRCCIPLLGHHGLLTPFILADERWLRASLAAEDFSGADQHSEDEMLPYIQNACPR